MWHVQLVTACPGVGKDGADGFECEGEQYGAIDIHVYNAPHALKKYSRVSTRLWNIFLE